MASIGPYKKRLISEGRMDPTGFARFIVSSREHHESHSSLSIFPPATSYLFLPAMKEAREAAFPIRPTHLVQLSAAECKSHERKKSIGQKLIRCAKVAQKREEVYFKFSNERIKAVINF